MPNLTMPYGMTRRSEWLRGLRCGSATVRLIWLRIRNPLGAWLYLGSVAWCQVEVSASGWSIVQRSPTECSVTTWSRSLDDEIKRKKFQEKPSVGRKLFQVEMRDRQTKRETDITKLVVGFFFFVILRRRLKLLRKSTAVFLNLCETAAR